MSSTDDAGASAAGLQRAINELIMQSHGGALGCMIARAADGAILDGGACFAEGWGPDSKRITYSVTKTVMMLLYLIAREKYPEALSDDTPLADIFPEYEWEKAAAADPRKKHLCMKHLVYMTDGLDGGRKYSMVDIMKDSDTPLQLALDLPFMTPPGETFRYDNVPSDLFALALQRVVKATLLEFAEAHLFRPLGIEGATWKEIKIGLNMGGSGAHLSLRDMLKIGLLIHDDGVFGGRSIVPPAAVRAWKAEVLSQNRFAHLWPWDGRGHFLSGIHGQCVCVADGYVVVTQGTEVGEHHEAPAHDKTRAYREGARAVIDFAREAAEATATAAR